MRRGAVAVVLAAATGLVGGAASACDDGEPATTEREQGASSDVTITTDQGLTDGLVALSEMGAAGTLRGLTEFDWDAVHVFDEGATAEQVEAAAGSAVLRDRRYYDAGNLLVFTLDGDVVRAISVVPDVLRVDHPSWGAAVRLEPVGDDTPAILRLVET